MSHNNAKWHKHLSRRLLSRLTIATGILLAGTGAAVGLKMTATTYQSDNQKPAADSSNLPTNNQNVAPINNNNNQTLPGAKPAPEQSSPAQSNTSQTQVTVNGQNIPVPQQGTVKKTVTAPDGSKSTVNISVSNNQSGTATSSSSSTSLTIDTHSSSNSTEQSSQSP